MYNDNAMNKRTFKGGAHLDEHKEITVDKKTKPLPAPKEVALPLSQHIGKPNEPIVNIGESVKMYQKIASTDAFVSSPVHAPVSGRVKSIEKTFHPLHQEALAIIIENDEKYEAVPLTPRANTGSLDRVSIVNIVKDAGIVGLGGAAFPTHVKLTIPKDKKIDTLIVNGAECEPYLTCDHRLMLERTGEILKGVLLTAGTLGAKNVVMGIEENKLSAIFSIEKAVKKLPAQAGGANIEIATLKTKYPQGGEKQLIKAVLGREVPPGKLPLDVGVVVQNAGTCFAIYEAVHEGKPLIERRVTLTGDCLNEPGNFVIKIGTRLKDAVDFCGGFKKNPTKIITGGPMMGLAQYTLDVPFIKGTTGVVFLSEKEAKAFEESECIKCAKCVDVCPVRLVPTDIMKMVKHSRWNHLEHLNVLDCMECGSCAYLCPSRIPLVQYIKLAKSKKTPVQK